MSQKVQISKVRVHGFVYVDEDRWTQSSDEVMQWLSDGWRGLFNNFRAPRVNSLSQENALTKSQFKNSTEYRKALPTPLLQGVERLEKSEWISACRRRKTTKSGSLPRFKRRKDGLNFSVLGSSYTWVRQLSKKKSELIITGRNPSGKYGPGSRLNWWVRIQFRHTGEIRDFTSVRVNWSRRSMAFVNTPEAIDRSSTGSMVGIDVGITHTLSNSNGEFSDIPRPSTQETGQHKKLQRKLARQDRVNEARGGREAKFNSNRRKKTLGQINRIASKQARRRNDWVEKVTTQLVVDHDFIALESLSPKKMSSRGGRFKRGLNRGILESCWGMFQTRLSFKAELAGVGIAWINPAYTSQTCNKCGHISRENRESQAVFLCQKCGHIANADINAANNILDRGLESVFGAGHALGRGADVRPDLSLDESGNGDEASINRDVSMHV